MNALSHNRIVEKGDTKRIFGLDVLRSFAIIIVVIVHSDIKYIKDFFNFPLPDGVDLFFVLSGYLIGKIIIQIIEEHQKFDLSLAFNFLRRRWFRTLPNYFLFLLINIVLINLDLIKGFLNKYLITFFVFFQNFYKPYDFLFWESWSLSVEEWFYLSFSVILALLSGLLLSYKVSIKKILLIIILLFIIFPLIFRLIQFYYNPILNFDLYYRKLVLTRMDTIGFGLLGAYLYHYYKRHWNKSRNILSAIGIILLAFLTVNNMGDGFILKTFYFSLTGLSILLLLPKLESMKEEKISYRPFRFISKISFSMYLLHIPLIQIISNRFPVNNLFDAAFQYSIFWILLIILSYLIYRFYEKPLMDLRDRY